MASYRSCIRIRGVPILPPVLDEQQRREMCRYREQAMQLECERKVKIRERTLNKIHQIIEQIDERKTATDDHEQENNAVSRETQIAIEHIARSRAADPIEHFVVTDKPVDIQDSNNKRHTSDLATGDMSMDMSKDALHMETTMQDSIVTVDSGFKSEIIQDSLEDQAYGTDRRFLTSSTLSDVELKQNTVKMDKTDDITDLSLSVECSVDTVQSLSIAGESSKQQHSGLLSDQHSCSASSSTGSAQPDTVIEADEGKGVQKEHGSLEDILDVDEKVDHEPDEENHTTPQDHSKEFNEVIPDVNMALAVPKSSSNPDCALLNVDTRDHDNDHDKETNTTTVSSVTDVAFGDTLLSKVDFSVGDVSVDETADVCGINSTTTMHTDSTDLAQYMTTNVSQETIDCNVKAFVLEPIPSDDTPEIKQSAARSKGNSADSNIVHTSYTVINPASHLVRPQSDDVQIVNPNMNITPEQIPQADSVPAVDTVVNVTPDQVLLTSNTTSIGKKKSSTSKRHYELTQSMEDLRLGDVQRRLSYDTSSTVDDTDNESVTSGRNIQGTENDLANYDHSIPEEQSIVHMDVTKTPTDNCHMIDSPVAHTQTPQTVKRGQRAQLFDAFNASPLGLHSRQSNRDASAATSISANFDVEMQDSQSHNLHNYLDSLSEMPNLDESLCATHKSDKSTGFVATKSPIYVQSPIRPRLLDSPIKFHNSMASPRNNNKTETSTATSMHLSSPVRAQSVNFSCSTPNKPGTDSDYIMPVTAKQHASALVSSPNAIPLSLVPHTTSGSTSTDLGAIEQQILYYEKLHQQLLYQQHQQLTALMQQQKLQQQQLFHEQLQSRSAGSSPGQVHEQHLSRLVTSSESYCNPNKVNRSLLFTNASHPSNITNPLMDQQALRVGDLYATDMVNSSHVDADIHDGSADSHSVPYSAADISAASSTALSAVRSVNRVIYNPYDVMSHPPELHLKLCKLSACVKGYLTRRLRYSNRVQNIVSTICDTMEFGLEFQKELSQRVGTLQDQILLSRLSKQLTGAAYEFHEIFFGWTKAEQMAAISSTRLQENMQKFRQKKTEASNDPQARKISSATLKAIERRKKSKDESHATSKSDTLTQHKRFHVSSRSQIPQALSRTSGSTKPMKDSLNRAEKKERTAQMKRKTGESVPRKVKTLVPEAKGSSPSDHGKLHSSVLPKAATLPWK